MLFRFPARPIAAHSPSFAGVVPGGGDFGQEDSPVLLPVLFEERLERVDRLVRAAELEEEARTVQLEAGVLRAILGELLPEGERSLEVTELEIGTSMYAQKRHVRFEATSVDRRVTIEGDRQIIAAAISNLLHNAFKFTRKQGSISLRVRATTDRVLFEVEDECGGLPPGTVDDLFRPFEQRGADRSGGGLGLSISLKAAKANAGEIHVRDLPGKGCIFTLDLPRMPAPTMSELR